MQGDIEFLKQHPNISFTIEGHCDERGSTEYNLALGDSRANSVRNALVQGGVTADHIKTISYGKEKPFCTESNEAVLAAEPAWSLRVREVRSCSAGVSPAVARASRPRPRGGTDVASLPQRQAGATSLLRPLAWTQYTLFAS